MFIYYKNIASKRTFAAPKQPQRQSAPLLRPDVDREKG